MGTYRDLEKKMETATYWGLNRDNYKDPFRHPVLMRSMSRQMASRLFFRWDILKAALQRARL